MPPGFHPGGLDADRHASPRFDGLDGPRAVVGFDDTLHGLSLGVAGAVVETWHGRTERGYDLNKAQVVPL